MRKNKTYSEKLKDPRWIKLSKETKEFYGRCSGCGGEDSLNTHHLRYYKGREPWEYDISELDVLCQSCHETFHKNKDLLTDICQNGRLFYSYEFSKIIDIIRGMCRLESPDYYKVSDFVNSLKREDF